MHAHIIARAEASVNTFPVSSIGFPIGVRLRPSCDVPGLFSKGFAMPITYRSGDACIVRAPIETPAIIAHIVNTRGVWAQGFVKSVSAHYPAAERRYRAEHRLGRLQLGRTDFIDVGERLFVANMIAQEGTEVVDGVPPIRYDALAICLIEVAETARRIGAVVQLPMIGTGLSRGDWRIIEPMILCAFRRVPAYVFQLT